MSMRTQGHQRLRGGGDRAAALRSLHRTGAPSRARARALLAWTLALLAALLVVTHPLTSVAADEAPQAGLVIQFDDGRVETRCIPIEAEGATGVDLLVGSGLDVIMDSSSGMGITVCQIEDLGCPYPTKPCFCQCMSGSECGYWNYFYREPGEPAWVYSPLGARLRQLQPGVVEAWVWGDGKTPPAGEFTFEAICGAPVASPSSAPESGEARATASPIPTRATGRPAPQPAAPTPGATGEPAATIAPTAPAADLDALPTATSDQTTASSPSLTSYWPFGLMVLALGAVAMLLRRRRSGGM